MINIIEQLFIIIALNLKLAVLLILVNCAYIYFEIAIGSDIITAERYCTTSLIIIIIVMNICMVINDNNMKNHFQAEV